MMGEDLTNMGVDLHSDLSFEDGDLILCKYEDNLVQSIVNRLNTEYDSLDLFYEEYGSFFNQYIGWKATKDNLKFIILEIENTLENENRIRNFEVNLDYKGDGHLVINLQIYPSDSNELLEVNLTTNDEGLIEVE